MSPEMKRLLEKAWEQDALRKKAEEQAELRRKAEEKRIAAALTADERINAYCLMLAGWIIDIAYIAVGWWLAYQIAISCTSKFADGLTAE